MIGNLKFDSKSVFTTFCGVEDTIPSVRGLATKNAKARWDDSIGPGKHQMQKM